MVLLYSNRNQHKSFYSKNLLLKLYRSITFFGIYLSKFLIYSNKFYGPKNNNIFLFSFSLTSTNKMFIFFPPIIEMFHFIGSHNKYLIFL